jgi:hypothetical protein
MMHFLAAILFVIVPFPSDAPRRCSMAREEFTRPIEAPVLVIQASSDSVLDGRYVSARFGVRRVAENSAEQAEPVYGQVVNVLATEGPNTPVIGLAKRAVLVWWSVTPSCTQDFPVSAARVRVGEAFVLSRARPMSEWINGIPTFDVRYEDWVYIPSEFRARLPGDSAMTVADYHTFFHLLPTSQRATDDVREARRRLLDWAAANPRIARQYPARSAICAVRMLLGEDERACMN